MFENETDFQPRQKAILVAADIGEYDAEISMDELAELADSAGADVAARVIQKRPEFDKATCVGAGKLEEICRFCETQPIDLLLFDHELSPSQLKNIEDITGLPVVDRTMLILDIFAQRARSKEGKLQVELAQLRYRLPRLMGQGQTLSRLGGGIGTRGPGESKLESDRRHIRRRIALLEKQAEELSRRRQLYRERRRKDSVLTVAIVGYTNVGKSSLLNALTDAGVLAENRLFATLDPTSRQLLLPDGRQVLLVDTVGLLHRLPHHLVKAFHSTLEEAAHADLLLHVCDLSSSELRTQMEVTEQLLKEIGVGEIPVLTVLNKCDLVAEPPLALDDKTALISAKTGYGLDALLEKISKNLAPTQRRMQLLVPYAQAGLIAEVRREGKVFSEEYQKDGIVVDALVDYKVLHRVEAFSVE